MNALEQFAEIKKVRKTMRRINPVGTIHAGGSQTILECAFCGAKHSFSSKWREPKHSLEFREFHNAAKCQN
jgi:hypothetical protein